jgi:CheY-like chemotaxis protein
MPRIIFIVDDNNMIRKILRQHFEANFEGVIVREAKDGMEAVETVAEVHPDLVILDMSMPRLNGLETARKFRELQIESPIILFTFFPDEARKSRSVSELVSVVVSKTNPPELYNQVASLLSSFSLTH